MNNIATAQHIANQVAKGIRDFGRVGITEKDDYVLLNYTKEAQYGGNFTKIEAACRGLVVRTDGKIMALCMSKFWNLGEPQCPPLPDEPYTVWEKVDGSLAIFWHDGREWRVNTRGSFDNIYITAAQQLWRGHDDGFPRHWTVMCEICIDDDEMPRAAYKPEGLYLIAIRDRYSGADINISDISTTIPKVVEYKTSIDELVDAAKEEAGTEGWVVRFDSGFRVKIKTAWYLRLFRAFQQLTPKHIRELMIDAGENWIDEFPDDLRAEAIEIQKAIEEKVSDELRRIYAAYSKVSSIESRKDYALAVMADYADISGWLFKLRDDRFDAGDVLRKLDLAGL